MFPNNKLCLSGSAACTSTHAHARTHSHTRVCWLRATLFVCIHPKRYTPGQRSHLCTNTPLIRSRSSAHTLSFAPGQRSHLLAFHGRQPRRVFASFFERHRARNACSVNNQGSRNTFNADIFGKPRHGQRIDGGTLRRAHQIQAPKVPLENGEGEFRMLIASF